MRAVSIDKDNVPFNVTSEAVRTNFAVFEQPTKEGRAKLALLLQRSDDTDGTAHMWSLVNPDNKFLVKGTAKMEQANRQGSTWKTELAEERGGLNPIQLRAIRSDVQATLKAAADQCLTLSFPENLFEDDEEEDEAENDTRTEETAVIRFRK